MSDGFRTPFDAQRKTSKAEQLGRQGRREGQKWNRRWTPILIWPLRRSLLPLQGEGWDGMGNGELDADKLTPVNLDYQLAGAGGAVEAAEFALLFGPLTGVSGLSAEQRETLAELDRQMAAYLALIDKKAGPQRSLTIITADHGAPPGLADLHRAPPRSGPLPGRGLRTQCRAHLRARPARHSHRSAAWTPPGTITFDVSILSTIPPPPPGAAAGAEVGHHRGPAWQYGGGE